MRRLGQADDRCLGPGAAGRGGGGEGRPEHHGCQGRGGCRSRLGAGLRQQALLDKGFRVWCHLTKCWETSLDAERERERLFPCFTIVNVRESIYK